ncbi:MAG: 16S rRNA (uracil(1498)-N(3))-methyltransferase [Candidatus Hydrogenedentes bacterium]|nr:16S rRNA (uracil(1498)-N(3))-methyltransferase [Candidatus Hydrogenedentota bacterium]
MPHLHRFHVSEDELRADRISLPEAEVHHALRVARVRVGDKVALFDGEGREAIGEVVEAGPDAVTVSVETRREKSRPLRQLTLAQAWLNREKSIEPIVSRGTELGVTCFVFFKGERSERAPRLHEKWGRLAIESCKQSGRLWLPAFELADGLGGVLAAAKGRVLIATTAREATSITEAVGNDGDVLVVIGPEGDFSEAELETALENGAVPISLGDYTLRSEVAATLALSLIQYELGELDFHHEVTKDTKN